MPNLRAPTAGKPSAIGIRWHRVASSRKESSNKHHVGIWMIYPRCICIHYHGWWLIPQAGGRTLPSFSLWWFFPNLKMLLKVSKGEVPTWMSLPCPCEVITKFMVTSISRQNLESPTAKHPGEKHQLDSPEFGEGHKDPYIYSSYPLKTSRVEKPFKRNMCSSKKKQATTLCLWSHAKKRVPAYLLEGFGISLLQNMSS